MLVNKDIDVTIIGNVCRFDGIGNHLLIFLQSVKDYLKTNILPLPPTNYKGVPQDLLKELIKPFNGFGTVSLWTYILGLNEMAVENHQKIKSDIKMAFFVFESDRIPMFWKDILNTYYNLVIVADENLVGVLKSSGVNIPIFVIPLAILIENLLEKPLKTSPGEPFTFGMSAGFWKRKNHIKLLDAFASEFGNDPKFKLKLHGRFGPYKKDIDFAVNSYNLKNVELTGGQLSAEEYDNFVDSIDVWAYPSMGEGYSITPREALALGRPCILSNNSAHKTICNSGFVIPLTANIKTPAIYELFGTKPIGNFYDCRTQDLAILMREVYNNYDKYLEQAKGGKEWVKQYLIENLKATYVNLLKPKKITFGDKNLVTADIFQTNDKKLYTKMKSVFKC
jgi:glycosyltransferase involved in cell wall biosynthesis